MKHNMRDAKGRFCKKALVESVTRGYKGFKKGLICRGKQYEVGKTYEDNGNEICEEGMMHFCENPLDVLEFYPAVAPSTGEPNEYAEVEAIGKIIKAGNKSATNKLRIVRKISLEELIEAAARRKSQFQAVTTDDWSNAVTTDARSNAATVGVYSYAATTGLGSNAATTGYESHATTVGSYSHAATSGRCSNATTIGRDSYAVTTGDYSNAITSGDWSRAVASGKFSIAAALGDCSKAKAALGSWIVLVEYNYKNEPLFVKAAKVDGKKIKPNTFYRLEDGEFVEA